MVGRIMLCARKKAFYFWKRRDKNVCGLFAQCFWYVWRAEAFYVDFIVTLIALIAYFNFRTILIFK